LKNVWPLLRHLRESKGRSQADVARAVSISPAHLARLEAEQRGLYVEDFVNIAEALGEKPGNLLPNDVGTMGHVKPLVDRLATVRPELLPHVVAILGKVVLLAEGVITAAPSAGTPRRRSQPVSRRKGHP
jgi:transcriptional regulator with XRE-family HTH domain